MWEHMQRREPSGNLDAGWRGQTGAGRCWDVEESDIKPSEVVIESALASTFAQPVHNFSA